MRELLHLAAQNVHRLPLKDRNRLVEYWLQEMREDGTNEVFESVKSAEQLCKLQTDIHDDINRRVLQTADVIGVTTTGLAKKISTLRHVMCKVVICEEAGEVMEPHMLSALLPSIEHFIQIGDHQQLRAKVNNHSLSLESKQGALYQLDRSQFERLSVGERGRPRLPVAQLDVQRRMRPEISALIRETIYPGLVDHEMTRGLPNVVGMRRNVFWLDHNNVEEGAIQDMHQKSHSNLWEVEFTYALVRHIIRQGVYKSSDIAVLTPYTGQLQKLRAKMRNEFEIVLSERDQEMLAKDGFIDEEVIGEGQQAKSQLKSEKRPLERKKLSDLLRIATVDNFQGEEAKIVIISLVRSNEGKKVGFLRTTNRINVLLSRAQHGVYLFGNTDTYSNIPMWAKVLGMLQATDSVGKALGLCCPRHSDTEIQVRQPDDFARLSPEGGCQLACDRRLSGCGHRCQARCHSESMHQVFPCPQPCQRLHSPCNHGCQKATCGEDCGICLILLDNVFLPCSHPKDGVPCHQLQDTSKIKCEVLVEKRVSDCQHVIQTQCWRDVTSETFSCPVSCEANLPCGHRCPGSCGRCHKKDANNNPTIEHRKCTKVCGRRFATCNHTCRKLCHDGIDCGPCLSPCEVRHFKPFSWLGHMNFSQEFDILSLPKFSNMSCQSEILFVI
jgi:AAA domain